MIIPQTRLHLPNINPRVALLAAYAFFAIALPAQTALQGAGATFPYPIYSKWFSSYNRLHPAIEFKYNPIGSEAGIRALLNGDVDFGGSDHPEIIRALSGDDSAFLMLPSVVGAVAPVVNLPGFTGEIAFTPESLAGIYLGRITKWNDPLLQQANRGVRLPDLPILVVHRADGSGTSFAFTEYLSKTSPDWKAQVGASLHPRWPVGRAATGNDGVAKLVKELGGAIGYVEFIYALQNHLGFGKVRNRSGEFVSADLESIAAAARTAELGEDFKVSIVDSPTPGAYPIATFTWFVVPLHSEDQAKRQALAAFLQWMLGQGQKQAASLGYVALPPALAERELAALSKLR